MGYAVGDEWVTSGHRFRGYGVTAWCDFPGCKSEIDRGMAYKCEEIVSYDEDDEEVIAEGCGLYFCSEHEDHESSTHDEITKLPDEHPEWIHHVFTDASWNKWRLENPDEVERYRKMLTNVA